MSDARHPPRVAAVLLDIEGTTTPIAFVYQTLFPYARTNLVRYVGEKAYRPKVKAVVDRLEHERSLVIPMLRGMDPFSNTFTG